MFDIKKDNLSFLITHAIIHWNNFFCEIFASYFNNTIFEGPGVIEMKLTKLIKKYYRIILKAEQHFGGIEREWSLF